MLWGNVLLELLESSKKTSFLIRSSKVALLISFNILRFYLRGNPSFILIANGV